MLVYSQRHLVTNTRYDLHRVSVCLLRSLFEIKCSFLQTIHLDSLSEKIGRISSDSLEAEPDKENEAIFTDHFPNTQASLLLKFVRYIEITLTE